MNEVLKRRLTGALVLLLGALLLGFLLPRPGPAPLDEGLRRVTLDLDAPPAPPAAVAEAPPVAPTPAAEVIASAPQRAAPAPEPAPTPASAPAAAPAATPPRPGPVRIRPSEQLAAAPADASDGRNAPGATPPLQLKSAERLSRVPAGEPAPVPAKPPVKSTPPTPQPDSGKDAAVAARTPPAAVAEATAPASGRWSVQIGSFSEPANAQQVETRLKAAGLPCTVTLIDTPKGKLHRVRISPLPGEAAARAARERAVQLGFAAATVRQD